MRAGSSLIDEKNWITLASLCRKNTWKDAITARELHVLAHGARIRACGLVTMRRHRTTAILDRLNATIKMVMQPLN